MSDLIHAREQGITYNYFPRSRMLPAVQARIRAKAEALHPKPVVVEKPPEPIIAPEPEPSFQFKRPFFTIEDDWPLGAHSIPMIQKVVCKYFRITMTQMLGQRRTAPIVRPRQVAMYLCRRLTKRSWPDIASRFGGRDHTTAIAAVNRIEIMMANDATFSASVNELLEIVQALHVEHRERIKQVCWLNVDKANNENESAAPNEQRLAFAPTDLQMD